MFKFGKVCEIKINLRKCKVMRGSGSEGQEPLTVSVKKLKYLGSTTRAMNEIKVEAMCRLNGGKGRWEAWAVW